MMSIHTHPTVLPSLAKNWHALLLSLQEAPCWPTKSGSSVFHSDPSLLHPIVQQCFHIPRVWEPDTDFAETCTHYETTRNKWYAAFCVPLAFHAKFDACVLLSIAQKIKYSWSEPEKYSFLLNYCNIFLFPLQWQRQFWFFAEIKHYFSTSLLLCSNPNTVFAWNNDASAERRWSSILFCCLLISSIRFYKEVKGKLTF